MDVPGERIHETLDLTPKDLGLNLDTAAITAAVSSVTGEVKKLANALDSMARGNDLNRYWKTQASSIEGVAEALERYRRTSSDADAGALVKSFNSFVALGGDVEQVISQCGTRFNDLIRQAREAAPAIQEAFNVNFLRDAFDGFEQAQKMGLTLNDTFEKLNSADSSVLQKNLEEVQRTL